MQLNRMIVAFGTSTSLVHDVIDQWHEHLWVEDSADLHEKIFYLPFYLVPDFIDNIFDQLSNEGQESAREQKGLIQSILFSALVLDIGRRGGHELLDENLPTGAFIAEVYRSASLITGKHKRRVNGYGTHLAQGYKSDAMTFNQSGVH